MGGYCTGILGGRIMDQHTWLEDTTLAVPLRGYCLCISSGKILPWYPWWADTVSVPLVTEYCHSSPNGGNTTAESLVGYNCLGIPNRRIMPQHSCWWNTILTSRVGTYFLDIPGTKILLEYNDGVPSGLILAFQVEGNCIGIPGGNWGNTPSAVNVSAFSVLIPIPTQPRLKSWFNLPGKSL